MLIAATLISWYVGADHGIHNHQVATTVILLVAFVKVRFVGLYFMELRDAPNRLRMVFEVHCLTVCAAMLTVYFAV
jgi:heme/copper-type cytochrome/quinol oxidase subunit 4